MPALVAADNLTLVRLWSCDWEFQHSVHPDQVTTPERGRRILTLPLGHPAVKWLTLTVPEERGAHMTIDDSGDRWSGMLLEFKIQRVGECQHCTHCMEKVVVSEWREHLR